MSDIVFDNLLKKRIVGNSLRTLPQNNDFEIDFASNDYLGFSKSKQLWQAIDMEIKDVRRNGSTGSRLLTGNSTYIEKLENKIAKHHFAEAGLIFNSGYNANLGLFSSLPQKKDTIIFDEYCHASIRDGIRLSFAKSFHFKHNDILDLEKKIKLAQGGNIYIAIESIYSMDGDIAPIQDIAAVCNKYNAYLIIDEAHANGVFGKNGHGLCPNPVNDCIIARVYTFGKALGNHGAIVVGSKKLKLFLINFAKSFIYTTALSMHALVCINQAYNLLMQSNTIQLPLFKNIYHYNKKTGSKTISPIKTIQICDTDAVKKIAFMLQNQKIQIYPILSPTVPKGKERLRVCLHNYNTIDEIDMLLNLLKNLPASIIEKQINPIFDI